MRRSIERAVRQTVTVEANGIKRPGYRGVLAWQKGMDLTVSVYRVSRTFPDEERYGLTSQIRRAAGSIPANIAEGSGRGGRTEFARFLSIANGSLCELETHLYLAHRLGYADTKTVNGLIAQTTEIARLLHGLIKSQRAAPTTND
jgi:four helix bundle protein